MFNNLIIKKEMKLSTKANSILLFSILFGIIQSGISQNSTSVTVEYSQKMIVDESKIADFPESIKETIRAKSKWQKAFLTQNKKGPYYMLKETLDDTITENSFDKTSTFSSGSKIYFNDFIDSKLYTQINMHEKTILIEEKIHKYDWKLESDTKIFDSIKCHKATTINNKGKKSSLGTQINLV